MTLIVWRDGAMAADSMVTKGSLRYGTADKIVRLPDGSLFGACGDASFIAEVVDYLSRHGISGSTKPKCDAPDGFRGLLVRRGDEYPLEMASDLNAREMRMPYAMIGENSAECIAAGALQMGATAEQAVQIAIDNCVWIGGKIQVETL